MRSRVDSGLQLREGRRLAYAEWGAERGRAVLFFHGTPSCRLFHHPDPRILEELGVRWISVDRPGYGGSTFDARRTLLAWPQDVEQLLEHLQLGELCVAGISGGGPYALACAWALAGRIQRTAIISGVGATDPESVARMHWDRRLGLALARRAPWLLPSAIRLMGDPRDVVRHYERVRVQCPSDGPVLERPEIRAMLMENWTEATRQGLRAYAQEGYLFSQPWGFDPRQIPAKIGLWHGTADQSIPLRMARHLADAIPDATLHEIPGAGHFLFFDHLREIVSWLLE
jgi:pimeloyl-ACP methyl ester carboxylesterase